MRVVWGHEDIAVPFAMQALGFTRDFGPCATAVVLDESHALAAVVVFHNWNPEAAVIEVSAAAVTPKWAQRSVLRELFGYVFSIAQACIARAAEGNVRVRRLWTAFGAEEHVIPRLRGRKASEAIYLLTDDAWAQSRFMRAAHGKAKASVAA